MKVYLARRGPVRAEGVTWVCVCVCVCTWQLWASEEGRYQDSRRLPRAGDICEGESMPTPPWLKVLCHRDNVSPLKDRSSVTLKTQSADLGEGVGGEEGGRGGHTYSTSLDQEGGLLMVMNTQLVKMVIMMNMLNSVGAGQGKRGAAGKRRA